MAYSVVGHDRETGCRHSAAGTRAHRLGARAGCSLLADDASCGSYRSKRFSMPAAALSQSAMFAIGELSRSSGVNIETIRYYERIKLLSAPARTAGGGLVS